MIGRIDSSIASNELIVQDIEGTHQAISLVELLRSLLPILVVGCNLSLIILCTEIFVNFWQKNQESESRIQLYIIKLIRLNTRGRE